jgi:hypothetical protein
MKAYAFAVLCENAVETGCIHLVHQLLLKSAYRFRTFHQLYRHQNNYYKDNRFCKAENGDVSLWKLYNLFTSANKTSYIDSFLGRAVGAASFKHSLADAIDRKGSNWFLR